MSENIGDGRKIDAARQVLRKLDKELRAKNNPYNPPESPSIQQQRQQLESNIQSQTAQQRNYNFESKTQLTPKTDSAWQDVIDNERRAARTRFEARKAERLGLAEGKTNQTGTIKTTAVRTIPGAEIPHLAVGGSVAGRNFSSKAFAISSGGAAVGSGTFAAIDFGIQLANGEDPIKAGFKAVGTGLGSFAGGVVGAAVGAAVSIPVLGTGAGVGAVVGGVAGGAAGSKAAENLYNLFFGNKAPKLKAINPKPQEEKIEPLPFTGGQGDGVLYNCSWILIRSDGLRYDFGWQTGNPNGGQLYGPIQGVKVFTRTDGEVEFQVLCRGIREFGLLPEPQYVMLRRMGRDFTTNWEVITIARTDGQPDTTTTPTTPTQLVTTQNPIIQTIPYSPPLSSQPDLKDALPALADKPLETNKRKPVKIQIPANSRATISQPDNPNGIVLTMPTGEVVYELGIPTNLNPQQPNQIPINISNLADPTTEPTTIITPGLAPIQLNIPGYQPITIDPAGDKQLTGGSRTLFDPRVVQAVPVGQSVPEFTVNAPLFDPRAVQLTPVKPAPVAPVTPNPIPQQPINPEIPFNLENATTVLTVLSGLKPVIDQIQVNTSPPRVKTTTKQAVCEESQPNGCIGSPLSSLGNLLGDIGGFLGSNLPYLINGNDQTNGALEEILIKLDELEQRLNEQQEPSPAEINLDEILQKLNKLSEIVGVDEYPASLPSTLIDTDRPAPANVSIANLTQFIGWFFQRFDEVAGQWEIPIEIKDSDPTTPGDQPQSIKLPNLAEAVAEMFTLIFQSYTNSELLLNIATRNLIESGMDKQQNFVSYKLLQSLTDWAGFKQKDIKLELPLTFTLNKTRYDEILQESKVNVQCVEFDDKFGLEADLMRFREASGILQAVYKRKLDPNGDIKGQILNYLINTYRGVNKVNDNGNFDEFLNQVENGFTDIPSVGDPTQPYGRPYEQRPKIRNLTPLDPSS